MYYISFFIFKIYHHGFMGMIMTAFAAAATRIFMNMLMFMFMSAVTTVF
jgi:hypothetical protein